jgi:CPA1 family monovalent cation:H+ antiporter
LIRKVKPTDPEDYLPDEKAEMIILQGLSRLTREYLSVDHANEMWDRKLSPEVKRIYIELLRDQRNWLLKENRNNDKLDEDIVRKFLMTIDMEEARASFR